MSEDHERHPHSADTLQAAFDASGSLTVGIEEEVMLLDPQSLELAPRAPQVLARLEGDDRFKLELPASQLEIITEVSDDLEALRSSLYSARQTLSVAAEDLVRPASAGVHPFSAGSGVLNDLPRYRRTIEEYAGIANRQLVCAFQVHVAPGDGTRALALYNAARGYLPLLAALAANAPYYEGRDTALASVRPKLCDLLPRQGVPPPIASWDAYAEIFRWGATAGDLLEPRTWWWELRPHPRWGTLEFRVPDAQTTVADGMAIAAVIQALVAWLADRHERGELPAELESWQIGENRWSACRHGTAGTMVGPEDGLARGTGRLLHGLLDRLDPIGRELGLGTVAGLRHARAMIDHGGALSQRRVGREKGARGVARWLIERFLDDG